jgi:hypothetical protein
MQVIMIAWLHAVYQRSRKVLIFLVVIFLAIIIANAVMLAIEMMQISGGKPSLCMRCLSASSSLTNIRGIHFLRHPSVPDKLYWRYPSFVFYDLDTCHGMGGPYALFRGLDCCEVFSVNYDEVSPGTVSRCWCKFTLVTLQGELIMWMRLSCSADVLHLLVFLLSLASGSV